MVHKSAILAGAFGGIIPSILRQAINLTSDPPKLTIHGWQEWTSYVIGVLLLALIGGVITWIWQEDRLQKALYLGIGLPSLIQVAGLQNLQTATQSKTFQVQPSGQPAAFISFIPTANAQTPAPLTEDLLIPGRKLTIVSANADVPLLTVAFFNPDGQQIGTQSASGSGSTVIDVLDAAITFAVRVGGSSSDATKLPDTANATQTVEVKVAVNRSSGFLQALGFAAGSSQYSITVSPAKPLPVSEGFCKFGIQSNVDGTWSERLFDGADTTDAAAIPAADSVLIANQDINVRSDFPQHVEGKGLYFRPTIGLLPKGRKVVVKEIRAFTLSKQTHYWMQFTAVK